MADPIIAGTRPYSSSSVPGVDYDSLLAKATGPRIAGSGGGGGGFRNPKKYQQNLEEIQRTQEAYRLQQEQAAKAEEARKKKKAPLWAKALNVGGKVMQYTSGSEWAYKIPGVGDDIQRNVEKVPGLRTALAAATSPLTYLAPGVGGAGVLGANLSTRAAIAAGLATAAGSGLGEAALDERGLGLDIPFVGEKWEGLAGGIIGGVAGTGAASRVIHQGLGNLPGIGRVVPESLKAAGQDQKALFQHLAKQSAQNQARALSAGHPLAGQELYTQDGVTHTMFKPILGVTNATQIRLDELAIPRPGFVDKDPGFVYQTISKRDALTLAQEGALPKSKFYVSPDDFLDGEVVVRVPSRLTKLDKVTGRPMARGYIDPRDVDVLTIDPAGGETAWKVSVGMVGEDASREWRTVKVTPTTEGNYVWSNGHWVYADTPEKVEALREAASIASGTDNLRGIALNAPPVAAPNEQIPLSPGMRLVPNPRARLSEMPGDIPEGVRPVSGGMSQFDDFVRVTKESGGATADAQTGTLVPIDGKYIVGDNTPGMQVPIEEFTPQHVEAYKAQNAEAFSRPGMQVGTEVVQERGQTFVNIDAIRLYDSADEANRVASFTPYGHVHDIFVNRFQQVDPALYPSLKAANVAGPTLGDEAPDVLFKHPKYEWYYGVKQNPEHWLTKQPETELVAVMNNEPGTHGALEYIMQDAQKRGVTLLDAWAVPTPKGELLPRLYAKYGWTEVERLPFDPQYYPDPAEFEKLKQSWRSQGWTDDMPPPDVVYMRLTDSAQMSPTTRKPLKKRVTLTHYGPKQLTEIDPAFQGRGVPSEELKTAGLHPNPAARFQSYYKEGATPEKYFVNPRTGQQTAQGAFKHTVEGDYAFLDLVSPEGIAFRRRLGGKDFDEALIKAGYDGYEVGDAGVYRVYGKQPVSKVNDVPVNRKPFDSLEEDELRGIAKALGYDYDEIVKNDDAADMFALRQEYDSAMADLDDIHINPDGSSTGIAGSKPFVNAADETDVNVLPQAAPEAPKVGSVEHLNTMEVGDSFPLTTGHRIVKFENGWQLNPPRVRGAQPSKRPSQRIFFSNAEHASQYARSVGVAEEPPSLRTRRVERTPLDDTLLAKAEARSITDPVERERHLRNQGVIRSHEELAIDRGEIPPGEPTGPGVGQSLSAEYFSGTEPTTVPKHRQPLTGETPEEFNARMADYDQRVENMRGASDALLNELADEGNRSLRKATHGPLHLGAEREIGNFLPERMKELQKSGAVIGPEGYQNVQDKLGKLAAAFFFHHGYVDNETAAAFRNMVKEQFDIDLAQSVTPNKGTVPAKQLKSGEIWNDTLEAFVWHRANSYINKMFAKPRYKDAQLSNRSRLVSLLNQASVSDEMWYDNILRTTYELFGEEDGNLFLKFLGATSQQKGPRENLQLALDTFLDYKLGYYNDPAYKTPGVMDIVAKAIRKSISGGEPSGKKINPFYNALTLDDYNVPVDRWIFRIYGISDSQADNALVHEILQQQMRYLAAEMGMTPRQVQARLWVGARKEAKLASSSANEPFEELMMGGAGRYSETGQLLPDLESPEGLPTAKKTLQTILDMRDRGIIDLPYDTTEAVRKADELMEETRALKNDLQAVSLETARARAAERGLEFTDDEDAVSLYTRAMADEAQEGHVFTKGDFDEDEATMASRLDEVDEYYNPAAAEREGDELDAWFASGATEPLTKALQKRLDAFRTFISNATPEELRTRYDTDMRTRNWQRYVMMEEHPDIVAEPAARLRQGSTEGGLPQRVLSKDTWDKRDLITRIEEYRFNDDGTVDSRYIVKNGDPRSSEYGQTNIDTGWTRERNVDADDLVNQQGFREVSAEEIAEEAEFYRPQASAATKEASPELQTLADTEYAKLDALEKPSPRAAANTIKKLEAQGIDTNEAQNALEDYNMLSRSDFDSADEFADARADAWETLKTAIGDSALGASRGTFKLRKAPRPPRWQELEPLKREIKAGRVDIRANAVRNSLRNAGVPEQDIDDIVQRYIPEFSGEAGSETALGDALRSASRKEFSRSYEDAALEHISERVKNPVHQSAGYPVINAYPPGRWYGGIGKEESLEPVERIMAEIVPPEFTESAAELVNFGVELLQETTFRTSGKMVSFGGLVHMPWDLMGKHNTLGLYNDVDELGRLALGQETIWVDPNTHMREAILLAVQSGKNVQQQVPVFLADQLLETSLHEVAHHVMYHGKGEKTFEAVLAEMKRVGFERIEAKRAALHKKFQDLHSNGKLTQWWDDTIDGRVKNAQLNGRYSPAGVVDDASRNAPSGASPTATSPVRGESVPRRDSAGGAEPAANLRGVGGEQGGVVSEPVTTPDIRGSDVRQRRVNRTALTSGTVDDGSPLPRPASRAAAGTSLDDEVPGGVRVPRPRVIEKAGSGDEFVEPMPTGRISAKPRAWNDVKANIFKDNKSRRMAERAAQKNPLVKRVLEKVSGKSAVASEDFEKDLVVYAVKTETDKSRLRAMMSELQKGKRPFVKMEGDLTEVTDWRGNKVIATLSDVLSNPKHFRLTEAQQGWANRYRSIVNELVTDAENSGVKVKNLFGNKKGYFYVPRWVVGADGIDLERDYVRSGLGVKQPFDKTRHYYTSGEGVQRGIHYHDSEAALEKFAEAIMKRTRDNEISEALKPLGRTAVELAGPESQKMVKAVALKLRTSRDALNAAKADVDRLQKKNIATQAGTKSLSPADIRAAVDKDTAVIAARDELTSATKARDAAQKRYTAAKTPAAQERAGAQLDMARAKVENARENLKAERTRIRESVVGTDTSKVTTKREVSKKALADARARVKDAQARYDTVFAEMKQTKRDYQQIVNAKKSTFREPGVKFGMGGDVIEVRQARELPALQGRFFPTEVIDVIEKSLGDRGSQALMKIASVNDLARMFTTSTDFGATMLQGLPVLAKSPKTWAKASMNSLRAWFDPRHLQKYYAANREVMNEMSHFVGGFQGNEFFSSAVGGTTLIGKAARSDVPLLSLPASGVERFGVSFDTFLDVSKIELWKSMRKQARNTQDLEDLGRLIRNMTGTTSTARLGVSTTQRQVESLLMFSPRFTRSVFALGSQAFERGVAGHEARKALGGLIFGAMALYAGVKYALHEGGVTEEQFNWRDFDPTQGGRFMSIKVGDNWIGIGGSVRGAIQLLGTAAAAAATDPKRFLSTETVARDANPFLKYARGRSSPVAGEFWNITTGKDAIGEEYDGHRDWLAKLPDAFVPFAVQSLVETEGGNWQKAGIFGGQTIGMRTFPEAENEDLSKSIKDTMKKIPVNQAGFSQDERDEIDSWADLTKYQKQILLERNPALREQLDERDREYWTRNKEIETNAETAKRDLGTRLLTTWDKMARGEALTVEDITPQQYRDALADIDERKRAAQATLRGANPISGLGGEDFPLGPRTRRQAVMDAYYRAMSPASYVNPATGEVDFNLKDEVEAKYLSSLPKADRDIIEQERGVDFDPVAREFKAAKLTLAEYWSLGDRVAQQLGFANAQEVDVFGTKMQQSRYRKLSTNLKERFRRMNPEIDALLVRWDYASKGINERSSSRSKSSPLLKPKRKVARIKLLS